MDKRWNELPESFDSLKPKDKLLFFAELLPYVIPGGKQVEATNIDVMDLRALTAELFPEELKNLGN